MKSASAPRRCGTTSARIISLWIGTVEIAAPQVWTDGPEGRFAGVAYIEKEGFDPILEPGAHRRGVDLAPDVVQGQSCHGQGGLKIDKFCGKRGPAA